MRSETLKYKFTPPEGAVLPVRTGLPKKKTKKNPKKLPKASKSYETIISYKNDKLQELLSRQYFLELTTFVSLEFFHNSFTEDDQHICDTDKESID